MNRLRIIIQCTLVGVLLSFVSCQKEEVIDPNATMLQLLSPEETGITFNNKIEETQKFNHFIWQSIYMGGGVAVGDINNDGLPDLFFSGNKVADQLYLNKGNLKFEDISANSNLAAKPGWSFGATMADVNADGYLDIYVCRSGPTMKAGERHNLLYINNGDATFTEQAKAYGLDNAGFSIQSSFFDYDQDGDLDVYLVNQPPDKRFATSLKLDPNPQDPHYSDRLFRNDGNKFTDVTQSAGLGNYAYGLNSVTSDINGDGLVDIYVSNDFEKPDFVYINQGNGKFRNENDSYLKHVAWFSMGSDVADFNNDGLVDITTVDMASPDHYRSKTNMGSMNIEQFWKYVDQGYHYQYMFNTLQLNNGNNTFSEIGQMAHMSKTDWSWAVFFADIDNDSNKDILISNGIKYDIRNNDFSEYIRKNVEQGNKDFDPLALLDQLPSTPLANYLYQNNGDYTFTNVAKDWGFGLRGFSNGMTYADLDNDGDLEVIINDVDAAAKVYKNVKGRMNNYLRVQLTGPESNPFAFNSKAEIEYSNGKQQIVELTLTRGYLSAVEPIMHFGLADVEQVDKLTVTWPDGKRTVMENVSANQVIKMDYNKQADALAATSPKVNGMLKDITAQSGVAFSHQENDYNDFAREILLPHKQSQNGPSIAHGDVNGDGQDDFFIGGALGQSGKLFLANGQQFAEASSQPWAADSGQEDVGALLFDADGDNDLDLYVVSGGSEFNPGDSRYQDRLYKNDGAGNFSKASGALPSMNTSGQAVEAGDVDGDGDLDLFVGGRIIPGQYPVSPKSYLLINNGGTFTNATADAAPELASAGLVTDAVFSDYDGDNDLDLVVVGEWTPIQFFNNDGSGQFTNATETTGLDQSNGWWWSVAAGDFNNDGKVDYMLGNLGVNHKFKAKPEKPFVVFGNDFDQNGTNDVVLASYSGDRLLPVRGRECTSEQMPFVAEKFPTFEGFAKATVNDIYTPDALSDAVKYEVHSFKSVVLINQGNGKFAKTALPQRAQFAPIRGMEVLDINKDGNLDVLAVGNNHTAEVETVRHDAGTGLCLLGDGKGNFTVESINKSGLFANGDARDIAALNEGTTFIVANNDEPIQVFAVNK